MTQKDIVTQNPPLDLPKLRTHDWVRYWNDLYAVFDGSAAQAAAVIEMRHPEFIQALAIIHENQQMSTERVAGIIMGVVLTQFLHLAGMPKVEAPPARMNINMGDVQ